MRVVNAFTMREVPADQVTAYDRMMFAMADVRAYRSVDTAERRQRESAAERAAVAAWKADRSQVSA